MNHNMKDKILHTPAGVRDIYNKECRRKLKVQETLHHVLELYCYQDIQTPTFEFFDIFNREKGTVASKEMYKFFDRDNNTLVLRPDMTPSIARCVAKYFKEEKHPVRLSYVGNTFIKNSSYQGKLKETTQLGAELIGDDTSAADAEILAMVIDSLLAVGLEEFQVDVGHVDFFKGIFEAANINEEQEENLKTLIENKNFFGLEEMASTLEESELKDSMLQFHALYGGMEVLETAKTLVKNKKSLKAIERLEKLKRALDNYGFSQYISFDLSMVSHYDYYTGIIFNGYTYGTGDALVKGGRYDNLLRQFGKDAPSIGYAFVVDEVLLALSRQKINVPIEVDKTLVLYQPSQQKAAIETAKKLRQKEEHVELCRKSSRKELESYLEYCSAQEFNTCLYFEDSTHIRKITIATKEEQLVDVNTL